MKNKNENKALKNGDFFSKINSNVFRKYLQRILTRFSRVDLPTHINKMNPFPMLVV